MKLQALGLAIFSAFLVVIKADHPVPSFLKLIGSYKYNATDDGKVTLKRYYSSQRITYKWIDAFMICKAVGMRLALIETNEELNNLAAMSRRNAKLFEKKVFVDGYNLTVVDDDYEDDRHNIEREPCYSLQKYKKRKLEIRSERCNSEVNKFYCERAEVVDSYEEANQSGDAAVDAKATFFTYIGNFENKKYYASFKLKAYPNNVPKICQSFGMRMVLPQNQAEYDNLGKLLQKFSDDWSSVSIAGYRSDENEGEWIVSNNKINYTLDWNRGEPNNHGEGEDCLALKDMGVPKMNDMPCNHDDQFMCEFEESVTDVKITNQVDRPIFLKPLTNYQIGLIKKEIFVSLHDVDWITANLVCRNFGMELVTPTSATEDDILRKQLKNSEDVPSMLHVGITSMGTDDMWYSINSGQILDFDLDWAPYYTSYLPEHSNCLKLKKYYDKFAYEVGTCINAIRNFMCQQVTYGDVQNITSTSPATWTLSSTTTMPMPNENDVAAIGT